MNFFEIYSLCGLIILAMMSLLWIFSLALKDASIVDIFWGMGFLISAWFYYLITPDGFPIRKLLVCLLVSTWALRLSIYIFWHNREKGEDYRYQIWRAESGPQWWWRSYFKVFLLQGILMWIISAPLLGAQFNSKPNYLTWLDYLGCLVWVIGFIFETAGDGQLASFKAVSANKGKVLSSGVWRYSRHPNYFGDCAQWWGYFLFACATGGIWTIFSPLIMTILLLRVSGVVLLEKNLIISKPAYREYIETTSAFFPWFPKKRKSA